MNDIAGTVVKGTLLKGERVQLALVLLLFLMLEAWDAWD